VVRFAQRVRERGNITVRRFDPMDTETEVRAIKSIYDTMLKTGWASTRHRRRVRSGGESF